MRMGSISHYRVSSSTEMEIIDITALILGFYMVHKLDDSN